MKKIMIFGSFLAIFLMLMTPTTSAILTFKDPDGPLKGGMDDLKDLKYYTWFKRIAISPRPIIIFIIQEIIKTIIGWLADPSAFIHINSNDPNLPAEVWKICYAEAYDLANYDGDQC